MRVKLARLLMPRRFRDTDGRGAVLAPWPTAERLAAMNAELDLRSPSPPNRRHTDNGSGKR